LRIYYTESESWVLRKKTSQVTTQHTTERVFTSKKKHKSLEIYFTIGVRSKKG